MPYQRKSLEDIQKENGTYVDPNSVPKTELLERSKENRRQNEAPRDMRSDEKGRRSSNSEVNSNHLPSDNNTNRIDEKKARGFRKSFAGE